MVLFVMTPPTFLYKILLHRLVAYKEQEAVLIVNKSIFEKQDSIEIVMNLKELFFKDVLLLETLINNVSIPPEHLKDYIINYYDNLFYDTGYSLDDFNDIIVINDTWDNNINLYFNIKKVNYKWIEAKINALRDESTNLFLPSINELINRYRSLSGIAYYATPILSTNANISIKKCIDNKKKYLLYNNAKYLAEINDNVLEQILKSFNFDFSMKTNKNLVILNSSGVPDGHGWNESIANQEIKKKYLKKDRFDRHSVMYIYALDIFLNTNEPIVVKTHPNDYVNDAIIKRCFGEEYTSFSRAPLEFITEYFRRRNMKFDTIIGIASESLKIIDDKICRKKVALGNSFFAAWYYYISLYVLVVLLDRYNFNRIITEQHIVEQIKLIAQVNKFHFQIEIYNHSIISNIKDYCDDVCILLENQNEKKIILNEYKDKSDCSIVFINNDLYADFNYKYRTSNWESIYIKKHLQKKCYLSDLMEYDEKICISTDNIFMKKSIREFDYSFVFNNSNLHIRASNYNL